MIICRWVALAGGSRGLCSCVGDERAARAQAPGSDSESKRREGPLCPILAVRLYSSCKARCNDRSSGCSTHGRLKHCYDSNMHYDGARTACTSCVCLLSVCIQLSYRACMMRKDLFHKEPTPASGGVRIHVVFSFII
jgi:hypothetical protein